MVYKQWVEVPELFRNFIWSTLDGKVPLEEMILRVPTYGRDIERFYEMYPIQTLSVAGRYPDIKESSNTGLKSEQVKKG